MPRLTADFSKISTEFVDLPEGDYRVKINEINEEKTKENQLPMLVVKLEVIDGDYEGKKVTDWVILTEKTGKINEMGYGRMKAYAMACLGEEAGSGGEIDTDQLIMGSCIIVIKHEADKQNPGQTRGRIKKVLAIN